MNEYVETLLSEACGAILSKTRRELDRIETKIVLLEILRKNITNAGDSPPVQLLDTLKSLKAEQDRWWSAREKALAEIRAITVSDGVEIK